jgi:hypothetical protein
MSLGLDVPSAVVVKTLTRPDVEEFLGRNDEKFSGLRLALEADPALWELMTTPLMLWVGAFTYEGISPTELAGSPVRNQGNDLRAALFDRYVDAMLRREGDKRMDDHELRHADVKHWLRETAAGMGRVGLFTFHLKDLGPKWLPESKRRVATLGMRAVVGLVFALVFGLCGGLFSRETVPVDTSGWSWTDAERGVFIGLVVWLGTSLLGGPFQGLLSGLFSELLYWLLVAIFGWPSALIRRYSARQRSECLLGLRLTAIHWSQPGFFLAFVCALATGAAASLGLARIPGFAAGLVSAGIVFASGDYIDRLIGRYVLVWAGCIPWFYEKFLRFAVQRVLLIRQGGSFRFVHRMLQEHLAAQAPSMQGPTRARSGVQL